jgi:2-dehydropantoate 2-reductase
VARGKPSEIDHINGYVLGRGAALGIATPVNRTIHALVKLLEDRQANGGR